MMTYFLRQHGRRAVIPEQRVLAESLDEVGFPADAAVEFDGRERAALEEHEHALAIGDRRRIAAGTVAMLAGVLLAKDGPPLLGSLEVVAEQRVATVDRSRQVDSLIEQDRRRTALARQRSFARDTSWRRTSRDSCPVRCCRFPADRATSASPRSRLPALPTRQDKRCRWR